MSDRSAGSAWLSALARHADERPDTAAVIDDGISASWASIYREALGVAAWIAASTPEQGVIAAAGGSGAAFLSVLAGTLAAGRSLLAIPSHLPDSDLETLLKAFRPDAAYASDRAAAEAARLLQFGVCPGGSRVTSSTPAGGSGGCILLRSSGTTGRSRTIMRGAAALARVAETLIAHLGVTPQDRIWSALPMHHSYGLEHGALLPILSGATLVQAPRIAPDAATRITEDRATILATTPFVLEHLAREAPKHSLRRVYSAGAILPPQVAEAFATSWGIEADNLYGASELGTITLAERGVEATVRGVEVRIVDPAFPDELRDLGSGPGEIAVRSDAMFEGYVDRRGDAPRPERIIGGFFRTGDVGVVDQRGLHVRGRLKLQFDVGGLKVNAEEVEAVLRRAPGVREVVVAPLLMNSALTRLRAVIERDDSGAATLEEIARFARAHLAPHQVPRSFELVERLPRTPSGKLLRGPLMEGA